MERVTRTIPLDGQARESYEIPNSKITHISHYTEADMLALARERGGRVDDPNKRHPLDFVLWHPSAPDEPSLTE